MSIIFSIKLLLILFHAPFLSASIVDCLKKIPEENREAHKMPGIDCIYMINLDARPEKWRVAAGNLAAFGITPLRFSAVNGWELSLEVINHVGLKFLPGMTPLMATAYPFEAGGEPVYEMMHEYGKTYFCYNMAKGSIGCALSHLSVLKDAYDHGYETIWVMEDDIEVLRDPWMIPSLIDQLDKIASWDVLFTDQNYRTGVGQYLIARGVAERPDMNHADATRNHESFAKEQDVSADFRKISARFATHSMIIRRSGIEKLLAFAEEHKIFLAYDLDNYFNVNRYSFRYDIVSNIINGITDNAEPFYKKDRL